MAYSAAVGVGEAAAIEKLCGQSRRVEAAECRLRVGRIGEPEGADRAIAPWLEPEPSEWIATVRVLAQVFCVMAAGVIPPAASVIGDCRAVLDERSGYLGPRPWPRDRSG